MAKQAANASVVSEAHRIAAGLAALNGDSAEALAATRDAAELAPSSDDFQVTNTLIAIAAWGAAFGEDQPEAAEAALERARVLGNDWLRGWAATIVAYTTELSDPDRALDVVEAEVGGPLRGKNHDARRGRMAGSEQSGAGRSSMSSRAEAGRVHVPPGSATAPRLRWVLVVGLLVANLLLLLLGVLAAVAGGGLADWGKGAGGLDGWPNDLMAYFSYPVGLAAAIATFRERRAVLVSVAVFATGLLISTGFLEVGHLLDPCARGWWDDSSTVGDEPLCSIQGEIAVRFHLLLHGASGLVAATVAGVIYQRARLFEWWPPEGRPSLEE